jgi:hypothetical protein
MALDEVQLEGEQPVRQIAICVHRTISAKKGGLGTTRLGYRTCNRNATIST